MLLQKTIAAKKINMSVTLMMWYDKREYTLAHIMYPHSKISFPPTSIEGIIALCCYPCILKYSYIYLPISSLLRTSKAIFLKAVATEETTLSLSILRSSTRIGSPFSFLTAARIYAANYYTKLNYLQIYHIKTAPILYFTVLQFIHVLVGKFQRHTQKVGDQFPLLATGSWVCPLCHWKCPLCQAMFKNMNE